MREGFADLHVSFSDREWRGRVLGGGGVGQFDDAIVGGDVDDATSELVCELG